MHYEELHQRYGLNIANKVQAEMNRSEFAQIALEDLLNYLELRAVAAHKEYQSHLGNPFRKTDAPGKEGVTDLLHRKWRKAQEISSIIAMAESVNASAEIGLVG